MLVDVASTMWHGSDIDLIRLGGMIGPICRSTTSVLDCCLTKKTRWYTTVHSTRQLLG